MMIRLIAYAHIMVCLVLSVSAFVILDSHTPRRRTAPIGSSASPTENADADVQRMKQDLLDACRSNDGSRVQSLVDELIAVSSPTEDRWLSGTWDLLYTPDDTTRSSPFFTAFRQAVAQADQIYDITDAIPAPLKEVGPATQEIDLEGKRTMVSRVKVATLGGQATSIMTTRCTIVPQQNRGSSSNCMILQVDSTKPEDSTLVNKLFGPLAASVQANSPPFPSGTALEQLQKGSSQVVWRHLYCDEGVRISRYGDEDNFCVWTRKEFATYAEI